MEVSMVLFTVFVKYSCTEGIHQLGACGWVDSCWSVRRSLKEGLKKKADLDLLWLEVVGGHMLLDLPLGWPSHVIFRLFAEPPELPFPHYILLLTHLFLCLCALADASGEEALDGVVELLGCWRLHVDVNRLQLQIQALSNLCSNTHSSEKKRKQT
jgi:hypothetical protein